jgi:acetyltransferase-like isoleucine patch superfamily enzyme
MFVVKTKFTNYLLEGWIDTEFIEVGDNVVLGQGSIIQSAVIIGNLFILRKTEIGDNVRIGAHSIVMPGSKIGNNCILAASSTTTVSQELEEGWIYLGVPAKKYKKNLFFRDGLEHLLLRDEDVVDLKKKYDLLYTKRVDKEKSEAN